MQGPPLQSFNTLGMVPRLLSLFREISPYNIRFAGFGAPVIRLPDG